MLRRLLLAAAFVLATASPVYGGALIHPDFWRYQNWMDNAEVPAPPGRVTFYLEGCPAFKGSGSCVITFDGDKPDDVFVDPDDDTQRATFLHEMGHVFDHQVLRPSDRRAFSTLAGRPGQRWDYGYPLSTLELFAAAYADCATGGHHGQYGWGPLPGVHRAVCDLIRRADRRRWSRVAAISLVP